MQTIDGITENKGIDYGNTQENDRRDVNDTAMGTNTAPRGDPFFNHRHHQRKQRV